MNNTIKARKRQAYGFRNMGDFKLRLCHLHARRYANPDGPAIKHLSEGRKRLRPDRVSGRRRFFCFAPVPEHYPVTFFHYRVPAPFAGGDAMKSISAILLVVAALLKFLPPAAAAAHPGHSSCIAALHANDPSPPPTRSARARQPPPPRCAEASTALCPNSVTVGW